MGGFGGPYTIRPCVASLGPDDKKPSYSMAGLCIEAENSGGKRFRCETIYNNGWCLGGSCRLYPRRGFGGRTPNTGLSKPVSATTTKNYTQSRGIELLGLDDPNLDPKVRDYWNNLLDYKVRVPNEDDLGVKP